MELKLINLSSSPRKAFAHGLLKGLAAPVMLFASNRANVEILPLPELPRVPQVQVPESIRTMTDMQRLGADFHAVVLRYEAASPSEQSAWAHQGD